MIAVEVARGSEPVRAISKEHGHRAGYFIRDRQIDLAVRREVARHDRSWTFAARQRRSHLFEPPTAHRPVDDDLALAGCNGQIGAAVGVEVPGGERIRFPRYREWRFRRLDKATRAVPEQHVDLAATRDGQILNAGPREVPDSDRGGVTAGVG